MYCINCGNKVDDNAYVCVNCGVILHNRSNIKTSRNTSNLSGIIGIVFGVFSFILSFMCFFVDISEVGMYTTISERLFYALGFTIFPIMCTVISLIFALMNKDNKCNRVGLALALAAAFLIISEFFVIGIY